MVAGSGIGGMRQALPLILPRRSYARRVVVALRWGLVPPPWKSPLGSRQSRLPCWQWCLSRAPPPCNSLTRRSVTARSFPRGRDAWALELRRRPSDRHGRRREHCLGPAARRPDHDQPPGLTGQRLKASRREPHRTWQLRVQRAAVVIVDAMQNRTWCWQASAALKWDALLDWSAHARSGGSLQAPSGRRRRPRHGGSDDCGRRTMSIRWGLNG